MPTIKQKRAFKEVLNGTTIKKSMELAGYSKKTAATTGKLTRTIGWKELTSKFLSDNELARKHNEQLNSSKLTKLYFDIDDDDEVIGDVCKKLGVELLYIKVSKDRTGKTANVKAPDFFFRDLALDKAYKLKGRYQGEGKEGDKTLVVVVTGESAKRYGINTNQISGGDSA